MKTKQEICFIVTAEMALKVFLLNHIRALEKHFDVTIIANTQLPNLVNYGINAKIIPLNINRKVSLLSDLKCLIALIRILHAHKFDSIQSITPKAGLLGMVAGILCKIPIRIHTFTGQVWANKKGFKRQLLKYIDKFISAIATNIIVDSPSQLAFLIREKVTSTNKSLVFGQGSISGVEVDRFKPNKKNRALVRQKLSISESDFVVIFLGRLNPDKGVLDLAKAFKSSKLEGAHLLYVGPDENGMQDQILQEFSDDNSNVHFVGYSDNPYDFMAAADVLCLPSYREGFGSVVIEAAAVEIPTIGSKIYGLTDSVVHNVTGLLHEPNDIAQIKYFLNLLYSNPLLRLQMGKNARERAVTIFNSEVVTKYWLDFYFELFNYQKSH